MSELIQVTLHTLEAELESLEAFDRWLDALSANLGARYKVGKARNQCGCPLAVFFTEELGMTVIVASDGIAVDDGRARHTRLTQAFIRWIDDGRRDGEPVTLAQAKQALKAARKSIAGGN